MKMYGMVHVWFQVILTDKMRREILITFFLIVSGLSKAQHNKNLQKSIFNVQLGTVGLWFNNEARIADSFALRSEIGVYTEIISGTGFFMAPEITLEPRWYYNIGKRNKNKFDIKNNAANFFTVKLNYRSNIFEISNLSFDRAEQSFAILPKWGIRRNINKNFSYEIGLGIGYIGTINQQNINFNKSEIIVDSHIRIGYTFR
jgi:hypothetical protein